MTYSGGSGDGVDVDGVRVARHGARARNSHKLGVRNHKKCRCIARRFGLVYCIHDFLSVFSSYKRSYTFEEILPKMEHMPH